jgi:hypothetical protein
MLGQLFIVTNTTPQLTLERTDSPNNTMVSFVTTAGALYAGQGTAGAFAVKNTTDLTTNPWFEVTSTAASFNSGITVTAGSVVATSTISLPSGSAASPSLRFSGDIDTGIFRSAENTIGFTTGGTVAVTIDGSGNLTAAGFINALSDARLKTDLKVIDNPLGRLAGINGYFFTRKTTGRREVGVIAQEVQRSLPAAVKTNANGMLSVAYGNLAGLLIEALKEQRKHRIELERRVASLEGRQGMSSSTA